MIYLTSNHRYFGNHDDMGHSTRALCISGEDIGYNCHCMPGEFSNATEAPKLVTVPGLNGTFEEPVKYMWETFNRTILIAEDCITVDDKWVWRHDIATHHVCWVTLRLRKNATIHQVTIMLVPSKNVLFPGSNHLLTTGADDSTLWLLPQCPLMKGHQHWWFAGVYNLEKGHL